MNTISKVAICAICINALSACGSGLGNSSKNKDGGNTSLGSQKTMELSMQGIEPAVGQHYEGWVLAANGVFTTGRFNVLSSGEVVSVDRDGNTTGSLGDVNSSRHLYTEDSGQENAFVLTIEPNGDTDDGPSSVHYVGGDFNGNTTTATTDHRTAIGAEFISSSFSYILATPTNGPSTHNQGIWFLDPNAGPRASLDLPALNTGWAYEGWIVDRSTGEVVSTGVFTSASAADSDLGGPAAGPDAAPPFPGQDFINPAKILNDGDKTVVISVEPSPDFDPAPFTLKILAHDIADGAPVTSSISGDNITNEGDISIGIVLK
ncbi:MAG: hypothetical protein AAF202_09275 [Pseudomonadota bacterium]